MKMGTVEEIEEELAFAKKAATAFAKDPILATWRDSDIKPGIFMALRWGIGQDCVVVVKLNEDHTPTNYQNLIKEQLHV